VATLRVWLITLPEPLIFLPHDVAKLINATNATAKNTVLKVLKLYIVFCFYTAMTIQKQSTPKPFSKKIQYQAKKIPNHSSGGDF
jgi:hypothetical protein